MLTDNIHLIKAALKNNHMFPTAVANVAAIKRKRKYTDAEKADLDVKTSNNLIGDVVNLSQELNTLVWHKMNAGATREDVNDIYLDICKLNVLSGLEIDKAKKEFVINGSKELMALRQKYERKHEGKAIKPNFFGRKDMAKGYYDSEKKIYQKHDTTMDYLEGAINRYRYKNRKILSEQTFMPFVDCLNMDGYKHNYATRTQVERVIALVNDCTRQINEIFANNALDAATKHELASNIRQETIEYIGAISFTRNTMIYLLKAIEQPEQTKIRQKLFDTLFGYPNTSFYEVIQESAEKIPYLMENPDGNLVLYNMRFTKTGI